MQAIETICVFCLNFFNFWFRIIWLICHEKLLDSTFLLPQLTIGKKKEKNQFEFLHLFFIIIHIFFAVCGDEKP